MRACVLACVRVDKILEKTYNFFFTSSQIAVKDTTHPLATNHVAHALLVPIRIVPTSGAVSIVPLLKQLPRREAVTPVTASVSIVSLDPQSHKWLHFIKLGSMITDRSDNTKSAYQLVRKITIFEIHEKKQYFV